MGREGQILPLSGPWFDKVDDHLSGLVIFPWDVLGYLISALLFLEAQI